jgi:hypothetical protein
MLCRDFSLSAGSTLRLELSQNILSKKTIKVKAEELLGAYVDGGEEKQGSACLIDHGLV